MLGQQLMLETVEAVDGERASIGGQHCAHDRDGALDMLARRHLVKRMVEMIDRDRIAAPDRLGDADELVDHVAHNPEAGDVIPGTGGVRKMRWGRSGSGKRGGARVIYFYYRPDYPLYLLLAYGKAQATDLTQDDKKAVAAFAATIKATVE
ncbi:MAG: type II toxin-antitoxin system RelE/ParE family toxin [Aeromonas media]